MKTGEIGKTQICHILNAEEASKKSVVKQQSWPQYHEVWISSTARRPNSCTARELCAHCAKGTPQDRTECLRSRIGSHSGVSHVAFTGVSGCTSGCLVFHFRVPQIPFWASWVLHFKGSRVAFWLSQVAFGDVSGPFHGASGSMPGCQRSDLIAK